MSAEADHSLWIGSAQIKEGDMSGLLPRGQEAFSGSAGPFGNKRLIIAANLTSNGGSGRVFGGYAGDADVFFSSLFTNSTHRRKSKQTVLSCCHI